MRHGLRNVHMAGNKYLEADNLSSSLVYGGGLYSAVDSASADGVVAHYVHDPFDQAADIGPQGDRWCTPQLNVLSGDVFFWRCGEFEHGERIALIRRILHPAPSELIFWPSDMVNPSATGSASTTYPIRRAYMDNLPEARPTKKGVGLLFDFPPNLEASRSAYEVVGDLLKQGRSCQRDEQLAQVACAIAELFARLNDAGFVYCDLHLDRIRLFGGYVRNGESVPLKAKFDYRC